MTEMFSPGAPIIPDDHMPDDYFDLDNRTDEERRNDNVRWSVSRILSVYDDPKRPGLKETPRRVARMYEELLTPKPFDFTTFDSEGANEMIVVRDIPFFSLCEHHMVPFYGTAVVAYIPNQKLAGLSKLARAVDFHSRHLQNQERLTNQIADFIQEQLEPQGVGVLMRGTHMCMAMRGVQKVGAITVTSALRGLMKDRDAARTEFLTLCGEHTL